jgi:CHAD domain-containing protein
MNSPSSVSVDGETPSGGIAAESERTGLVTAEMPVADAFSLLAAVTVEEAIRRVRKLDSKADPEVLHKLRVALRRMRSLWWAYEPLLDRKDAKFLRSEFKSLANAAGKTRDWDVLRDLLQAGESMQHSFTSLLKSVDVHRADALCFSCTAIGNAGVERILESARVGARYQLDSRATIPTLAEFAEDRVGSAEKALKKRVKRAVSQQDSGYAVLHEVRISGKRLRYLLEFFSPVLEGNHQATIERLTSVQDELGKLNDIVTSEALLREYSPQLGEPHLLKDVLRYLEDQKKRRMQIALEILRMA